MTETGNLDSEAKFCLLGKLRLLGEDKDFLEDFTVYGVPTLTPECDWGPGVGPSVSSVPRITVDWAEIFFLATTNTTFSLFWNTFRHFIEKFYENGL